MNRGRRREQVYKGDGDYHRFIALLQEAVRLWDVRIGAFCLMTNHYHLLIHTPLGNLSRCMRHINGVYTQRTTGLTVLTANCFEAVLKPF